MKRAGKYLLLLIALFFFVSPVYWMLTISLKSEVDQFASPPAWLLFSPTIEHYVDAFVTRSFLQYLITSAIVSIASTLSALVIGTLAAYSLARFRLPYKLDNKLSLWILVDAHVSSDRYCGALVFDDARSAFT